MTGGRGRADHEGVGDLVARWRSRAEFRADLLRTLGPRHAVRRVRANRAHRRASGPRHARVHDEIWREAACAIGADVRELGSAVLEFTAGGSVTRVRRQLTSFTDLVSARVAADKPLAYRLMREHGVLVPEHTVLGIRDLRAAERFLEGAGRPCVVKPVSGGGGIGVTGEIRTAPQLRRALVATGRYCSQALLEAQVPGDIYRVLLLDGDVLDVVKRRRPQVVGDGRSTIEELMFRRYAERISDDGPVGLKPFQVDLDCLFTLEQAGYRMRSVPPARTAVTVKTTTNFNGAEDSETLPPPYPEGLVEPARKAARALAVRLAGVDVALHEGAEPRVLEVNPAPGLTQHYGLAGARRVAIPILAALLGVEVPSPS